MIGLYLHDEPIVAITRERPTKPFHDENGGLWFVELGGGLGTYAWGRTLEVRAS